MDKGKSNEIGAMAKVDGILSNFEDEETRQRILKWAADKITPETAVEYEKSSNEKKQL